MAAVIRLKRRVDEDPLDAFVLNCKRQRTAEPSLADEAVAANGSRTEGATSDEISTVLKFAGTFSKADNISTHLQQRLSKEEAKEVISRVHRPKAVSKNRAEAQRQNAQNSRFRIVNCTRSLSQVEGVDAATTIVDVERDVVAAAGSAVPSAAAPAGRLDPRGPPLGEQDFVYDLYVVDENQAQPTHVPYIPDNLDDISVAIYDDPLYSSHRGLGDRSDDSMGEESEDSNDENNWRNDYPDEDEDVFGEGADSVDEDDMRRAVEEIDLDGDRDLSSDEEDYGLDDGKGFAYPRTDDVDVLKDDDDDDEFSDEDELRLNKDDVARYGTAYARYKARILKQMNGKKTKSKRRSIDSDEYDSEISDEDRSSSAGGSESENFDLYD